MTENAKVNYYETKIAGRVSFKGLFYTFRLLCDRESSYQQSNISAESFNKYLNSVAADLAVKFETEAYVRSKIENVLKENVCSVWHTNDVVKVIKDFQNKSSIGPHGISKLIANYKFLYSRSYQSFSFRMIFSR